jgi:hypothetical protein
MRPVYTKSAQYSQLIGITSDGVYRTIAAC